MFSDMKKIVSFNVADSPQYEKSALQVSCLVVQFIVNVLICISLWLRYFQNQAANLENLETNLQRGIAIQRKVSAKKNTVVLYSVDS